MEKNVAVIGLGSFGRQVCATLSERGGSVVAIDTQRELVDRVKDSVAQAMLLDSTDESALAEASLEDLDAVVVAIGDNIEASILTTALLKRLGVAFVVARAVSDIHQQVLRQVGADEVLNIEVEQGARLAERLIAPDILERIPVSQDMSMAEIYVPAAFVGSSLAGLRLRGEYGVNVIALKRGEASIDELGASVRRERVTFPQPTEVLRENDILMVIGKNEHIERLTESADAEGASQ